MERIGGNTYKIHVGFAQGEEEAMAQGGKAGRQPYIRGKLGENTMKINFKSMAKIGLGIRQARMVNEMVGAYTGNRLRQRRVAMGMQMGTYAIGIAKFGVFGAAYAVGDLGYRVAMHTIDLGKRNREAEHLRNISGIANRSISRHEGNML